MATLLQINKDYGALVSPCLETNQKMLHTPNGLLWRYDTSLRPRKMRLCLKWTKIVASRHLLLSGGNTATHQRNTGLEAMVPFPAWKNPDCRFATTPRVQGNCGTASNKQRPVMTKLEYSQNLIFKYLSTVLNMKWYYLLTKKNTYWCVHKRTSFNTGVQKINC